MRDFELFLRDMAAILFSIAALFLAVSWWGGGNVVGFIPPIISQFAAIVCVVFALLLLIASWVIGNRRNKYKEKTINGFNITVDSRDFVSMGTKQIKAVFDGLEKLIKTKQAQQNKEKQRK